MSNILTSHLRLFAPGGQEPADWPDLARRCMDAYGRHGSYWVPAAAAWRAECGALDLRFGSSKSGSRADSPLEDDRFLAQWRVWRRVADEDCPPDRLVHEAPLGAPGLVDRETCRYGFDAVEHNGVRRDLAGTFTASTSWADVGDDPRCGPCAPWTPGLDPAAPTPWGELVDCDAPELQPFLGERPPEGTRELRLLWRGQEVHRWAWEERDPDHFAPGRRWHQWSGSGWHNLQNNVWLSFLEDHHRGD